MFKYVKGHVYIGEWINGKQSGSGRLIMNDGLTYVGEFKDNLKNGKGLTVWPNG